MSLHLFKGFGIELEYMIVNRETLDVAPLADRVLFAAGGDTSGEVELGELAWSNELMLHVIELKTNGPAPALTGLARHFADHVRHIDELLAPLGARLMPTAMHPWMDPWREARLWPHGCSAIYQAYDRIFDCRGHGWSNLQSAHLNLPFAGEDEFARLHAAVRLVLPILPALAAASPLVDGLVAGSLDQRLEAYRLNQKRVPSIAGRVIPEPIFTPETYRERLLGRIYHDIAPHDPDGLLQHEWLNSRGAIARFQRNAIEIRLLDVQECPGADLAIAALIVALLRALVAERWADLEVQQDWPVAPLEEIFLASIHDAERALIRHRRYLAMFGLDAECSIAELWAKLFSDLAPSLAPEHHDPLRVILGQGPLARRILNSLGGIISHERIMRVYRELCDCLSHNRMFQ